MARNVSLFGRRELVAHRRFVTGVTGSKPAYKAVDAEGNKEWVVDVYLGPLEKVTTNTLIDVPIAPYARNLVTDFRQPVLLERSREGKYTVIGRSKVLAAGVQTPEGSIDDATYLVTLHNYADLGLRFVADLDYELEEFQPDGVPLQADPSEPLQVVRAFDAFGLQVLGPEATIGTSLYEADAASSTRTRHVVILRAKLGPKGDPDAMDWGVSILQPMIRKIVEQQN